MSHVERDLELDIDSALAAVQSAIERERGVRGRMRALSTPVRIAIAAAAVLAGIAVAIGLTQNWAQLEEAGTGLRPVVLTAYVVLLAVVIRFALRPMQRIEAPRTSRALAAVGVLVPFLAAGLSFHDSHEIPGQSGYCVLLGTALAGLLVGLLRILDRGAHTNQRSALLAVAVSAMASNLALEFHCPITRAGHKLAFHASVGVLLTLGYLLATRNGNGRAGRKGRALGPT